MTLDQAKARVLQAVNIDRAENSKYIIDEAEILDVSCAWYIPFIEINRAIHEILIGSYNGFIFDKTTGEMYQPGSSFTIEDWLTTHELGLLNGPHDFEIIKINDLNHTGKLLEKLRLKYFKPEIKNETIWKIPQIFTIEMIDNKLKALPCVFKNQNFTFCFEIFQVINSSKAFEYRLTKHTKSNVSDIGEEVI